jgi:hypothetical protein
MYVWMLSPVATDDNGNAYPTCSAYANGWMCPAHPDEGKSGLVYCQAVDNQIEAAQSDPSITVCPTDSTAVAPDAVVDAYIGQGTTRGMTMGDLLKLLSAVDRKYLCTVGEQW